MVATATLKRKHSYTNVAVASGTPLRLCPLLRRSGKFQLAPQSGFSFFNLSIQLTAGLAFAGRHREPPSVQLLILLLSVLLFLCTKIVSVNFRVKVIPLGRIF